MNKVTITLTDKQALYLIHALWMDIDNRRDATAPDNAFIIRIANKLTKAYSLAKSQD